MKKPLCELTLARKFSWWWKEPGVAKAMMRLYKASPLYYGKQKQIVMPPGTKPTPVFALKRKWFKRPKKLTPAQYEELCLKWYVEYYSECAFWYELHARRAFAAEGDKGAIAYGFGVPFHKLTSEQIERVSVHHRASKGNPPPQRLPSAYVGSFWQDIADPATVKRMREATGEGWTAPMLFSFNLKQCSDDAICTKLREFFLIERRRTGTKEPTVNEGKKLRIAKKGKSFTEIETLDVFARLPSAEAKKTTFDDAVSRRAKRLIKEWFQENNPR